MSSAFEGLPKTPNLKLNKPGYDNVADIEALNENADILDAEIQGIKNTFVKSVNGINAGDDGNVDLGIIPIAKGGTGATTVASARNALGLGNTSGAVPIANGGTGATTASDACANIGALPLNGGGTVKSLINNNKNVVIAGNCELSKDVDNQGFEICGGVASKNNNYMVYNGATLNLCGKDLENGRFSLSTYEGNQLVGNGTNLTWNDNEVVTCVYAYTNGRFITRRYSDGLQIVAGNGVIPSNNVLSYTFPAPFAEAPQVTANAYADSSKIYNVLIRTQSATGVTLLCVDGGFISGVGIHFIAIGRWE